MTRPPGPDGAPHPPTHAPRPGRAGAAVREQEGGTC